MAQAPANDSGEASSRVHAAGEPLVGVDLGATGVRAGVVDADAHVISRCKEATPRSDPAAAADAIARCVRSACERAGVEVPPRVGIGVPGPVVDNVLRVAVNLGWRDAPLGELVGERLGVPCVLCNDVTAAAIAEHAAGAASDARDCLAVWVGTGVGGGAVIGGRPYLGRDGVAVEIGHTIIDASAPEGRRTVESRCSRRAILREVRRRLEAGEPSTIADPTPEAVADAYRSGDEVARSAVDAALDLLGAAAASACALLGVRLVVVGGALVEAIGPAVASRVGLAATRDAFPPGSAIDVRISAFGDDAGLIGAGMAAAADTIAP